MQIDVLTVGTLLVAVIAIVTAVFSKSQTRDLRQSLDDSRSELDAANSALGELQAEYTTALSDCTEARTLWKLAEAQSEALVAERDLALKTQREAEKARVEAERNEALALEKRNAAQKHKEDWEATKVEHMKHAQAATLATAQELSSKLLNDHKRESEAAKKETDERVRKATEPLGKHFEGIANTVTTLQGQMQDSKKTIDTVWQALSSPGGAGYYAQIGLENTLKQYGLQKGRDFSMEHHIDVGSGSRRLRPDAVVFLPSESVLVIDSKASKFLLEIAELEGTDEEEAAYANLARTMNQHMRALAGKDYKGAILEEYRNSGRSDEIQHILSVMYLPNEAAIERLHKADPEFAKKMSDAGLILAGPSGLSAIVGFSRNQIDFGRQAANQEKIISASQSLLEGVAIVLGHMEGVGKGLKSATGNFEKMTKSINSRLLPRTRGLMELGVRPTKNRSLPIQMPQFQLVELSQPAMIDGDAAEVPGDDAATPASAQDILTDQSDAAE
jgi:DNA recombination protein RmuC